MDKNNKGGAMNDFDFEELDKAVNSLAAKTKTENNLPASSAPTPVTVTPAARRTSPTSAPAEADPKAATPPSTSDETTPQTEAPSTPVVAPSLQHAKRLAPTPPKRRGAFMDIMAPSNKGGTRRIAPTLQPLSAPSEVKPEAVAKKDQVESAPALSPAPSDTPAPLSEPEKTPNTAPAEADQLEDRAPEIMADKIQAPEPTPVTTPKKQDKPAKTDEPSWPDPLDFQDFQGMEKDEAETEEKPAPTSPFLPEAKVEKRPLGAFSGFSAKPPEQPDTAIPADAPELKSDDELTPEPNGVFKEPDAAKAPTMHDAPKEKAPAKDEHKTDTAKPDMQAQAMMSIPKQYHTKEKPADTAKRPVFDTKEYHPPLLEAAVHEHRGGSSMWSKLFIALATLVLLGVAGYFAYLYFVQQ